MKILYRVYSVFAIKTAIVYKKLTTRYLMYYHTSFSIKFNYIFLFQQKKHRTG